MKQETGAPAALRRLEEHELRCAQECDKLKAERDRLRAMQEPEGDEALRNHHNAIQNAISNLADAQDDWNTSLKSLREFDKAVAPEKREGEKLLRADVEEFMQQVYISIDLAIESYIISLSQDATRAESPEGFYQAHADNLRSCKVAAIEKAIQDKKLPTWAKIQ